MTRPRALRTLFWPLVPLVALGCGQSGSKLYNVSGKVTFKGQPVPAGWVNFTPDGSKKNDGPDGRARIKAGAFDTAGSDGKGTVGGPMIVRIQGFDGQGTADSPDGKPLFASFETSVDLPKEKTTKDLEVPESWGRAPVTGPPP